MTRLALGSGSTPGQRSKFPSRSRPTESPNGWRETSNRDSPARSVFCGKIRAGTTRCRHSPKEGTEGYVQAERRGVPGSLPAGRGEGHLSRFGHQSQVYQSRTDPGCRGQTMPEGSSLGSSGLGVFVVAPPTATLVSSVIYRYITK